MDDFTRTVVLLFGIAVNVIGASYCLWVIKRDL